MMKRKMEDDDEGDRFGRILSRMSKVRAGGGTVQKSAPSTRRCECGFEHLLVTVTLGEGEETKPQTDTY